MFSEGTAVIDASSWWATLRLRAGDVVNTIGNAFLQVLQFVINPTNSQNSYEKAAMLVWTVQKDPSDYVNHIERDGVGADIRGELKEVNNGRVWAEYLEAKVNAGANGYAVAQEVAVVNNGAPQSVIEQIDSKVAHNYNALGTFPATAVAQISAGQFYNGWISRVGRIVNGWGAGAHFGVMKAGSPNEFVWKVNHEGVMEINGRKVVPVVENGKTYLTLE